MRSLSGSTGEFWDMRAERLSGVHAHFDIVTCLWNVLGHIFPASNRIEVLRQFARLASPDGRIFIDVNHRYNLRHYGVVATLLRFMRDRVAPNDTNGDVLVTWDIDGTPCRTGGHVFTDAEFVLLCGAAGLAIEKRYVVDYGTGELRKASFMGNLLYVLRPAS
jgi:hypothetical protein